MSVEPRDAEREVDRIAPTRRPDAPVAMYHRWADLLFLHWRVPVAAVRDKIPSGLEVDTFDGDAWVGLVPFTMTGVRPVWAPAVRAFSDFHETNVRTYVHKNGRDPGVWFFSLDAANSLAVVGARSLWRLPYHRAKMALVHASDGAIEHRTERRWPGPVPASCAVRYRPEGAPTAATPGTLEHFLAERYVLYAQGHGGALYSGRVHHKPYPLQRARVESLEESLLAAAGIARPGDAPLAHYASEVQVEVFPLVRV